MEDKNNLKAEHLRSVRNYAELVTSTLSSTLQQINKGNNNSYCNRLSTHCVPSTGLDTLHKVCMRLILITPV